jgi:hypothetical protein
VEVAMLQHSTFSQGRHRTELPMSETPMQWALLAFCKRLQRVFGNIASRMDYPATTATML